MRKIGINAELGFDFTTEEMIKKIKAAGFDAIFTGWGKGAPISEWKALADSLGLEYTFIHAPFGSIEKMWDEGDAGDDYLKLLCDCIDDCAANSIPIMICHVFKGFGEEHPNALGVTRFEKLLDYAEAKNITVAFENTEGESYLDLLMTELADKKSLGFCIDTGHEMCYNYSKDLIGKYAGKLVATHLNDNLGILGESIFWLDDLHLLPFDGICDFKGVAERIKKTDFNSTLMFELTVNSKPGRNENDKYKAMGVDAYLDEAYKRASKCASFFEN